jgi:hypothetical protein
MPRAGNLSGVGSSWGDGNDLEDSGADAADDVMGDGDEAAAVGIVVDGATTAGEFTTDAGEFTNTAGEFTTKDNEDDSSRRE